MQIGTLVRLKTEAFIKMGVITGISTNYRFVVWIDNLRTTARHTKELEVLCE